MTIEFSCQSCRARYKVKDDFGGKSSTCKKCGEKMEIPYPPLELPDEVTEGGSVIHRHEARMRDFEMAVGDSENIEKISDHIEKYIGPIEMVFHELVSDMVHIDVHWVPPTEDRPFHTLVTSGMSDKAMLTPDPDVAQYAHAELMIQLPPDWPIDEEAFQDENNFWPVHWLKSMARFPHEYETWVFEGHTIPNGDPPQPFADNTGFCGWLLYWPLLVESGFCELEIDANKTIHFLSLYPLYEGEMNYKLNKGTEKLLELFEKREVLDIIDIDRPDVTQKKGWWPFS